AARRSTLFPYTTLFRSGAYELVTSILVLPLPVKPRFSVVGRISTGPAAMAFANVPSGLNASVPRIRIVRTNPEPGRHVGEGHRRSEEHTSELQSPYDLV